MKQRILEWVSSSIQPFKSLRDATEWINDWVKGLRYGSYSLQDEVALAVSILASQASEGGVVIDAGANSGRYTRELLGSGVKLRTVLMIEPSPSLGKKLNSLAAHNPTLALEPVAVGSTSGKMDLHFDTFGSPLASLYPRDVSHAGISLGLSTPVPVTTLDKLAKKHRLETIDFLKLDLEGHELEALRGAKEILKSTRVRALSFEFGGANIDSRTYFKDFWKLLAVDYGYSLYRQLPRRQLLLLSCYDESLERFSWQNILACAPGVAPLWKIRK